MIWTLLSYLLFFTTVTQATIQRYELELTNRFVSPDGSNRSAVLANGRLPGPVITAYKNDQLQIKIVNKLTDTSMAQGTSIHWHGMFQDKTASQDGVTWVTQCPIAAGESFLYNFNVGEQTGTYWYHSHITTQYCDGLRGALVVYDRQDPLKYLYDVDNESTIITLGDWFHRVSPQAFAALQDPEGMEINGLGRFPGGPKGPLSVVEVTRGLRYRLRLINTACIAAFNVSIDSHTLTVIETDGSETKPHTVDRVSLFPGQRLSVIVKASQAVNNYWIRAVPFVLGVTPSTEIGMYSAILRYQGAKKVEPRTKDAAKTLLLEQDLEPLERPNWANGTPDVKLSLNITLNAENTAFQVNGFTYTSPSIPVLLQIMNGSVNPHEIMPNGSVITLLQNKLIEVTVPGGSPFAPHPMHLHGHAFVVVQSAGAKRNWGDRGPIRDVVNTGLAGDNVTFRFRTDNPGPWMLHCHIDFHLEGGLAIVFAEAPKAQVTGALAQEKPKNWEALCPKWDSLKTGKQYSVSALVA